MSWILLPSLALINGSTVPSLAPLPLNASVQQQVAPLALTSLQCVYTNTKAACRQHVLDNFAFYQKTLYPRDAPYTASELSKLEISGAIQQV